MPRLTKMKKKIGREEIIRAISNGLIDHPAIFSLWLEGSDANDTVDKFSDLDFWLDVQDGKESEVFLAFESASSCFNIRASSTKSSRVIFVCPVT